MMSKVAITNYKWILLASQIWIQFAVSTKKKKTEINIQSRARIVYNSIVQKKIYNEKEKKNHTSVTNK